MKILLVEDELDLGRIIQNSLNQEKYIVDWFQDGDLAWQYLESQATQYTLAILDWLLPGLSGIELCQRLRAQGNPLPILMLTAKDGMADKVAGLDAGADDYLVKPFKIVELLARLRALQRRSPQMQPQQLQVGNLKLDFSTSTVTVQDDRGRPQSLFLTNKEFQLLEYFMRHPNQILSRDRLMNQLWEINAETISNVVAAQVRLLRRKLGEYGYDKLIETIPGMGYRLNPPS
ncbi:two-component system response regulator RppA [Pseudanabaena sp. PCC 6802]|uniref:two-component system response regulator RppA n=1 Tax=Pseudanabaena sp. PCC 6802 TaxID=118173 RepID=UPI0003480937|nr:two-component system response regulator RppA [Pseudanabaena sp. PCC 6802]